MESRDAVTREMALEEEFFLGLRKSDGIDVGSLERSYGVKLGEKVERLRRAGMIEDLGERIRVREEKMGVSNEAIVEFLR